MECKLCSLVKLPNEFPPEKVTSQCRHPPLVCLRCTIDVISKTSRCPVPACRQSVKLNDDKPKLFQAILKQMFEEYEEDEVDEDKEDNMTSSVVAAIGTLTVTVLTGESITIKFDPKMKVLALKQKIKDKLGHKVDKQKLLFNGRELQNHVKDRHAVLSDYNCKPYTTLCLVVLLFAIPDNFNHVVFDLYWGYPTTGKDFLDASCLLFRGGEYVDVVDYCCGRFVPGVVHSGDVMDHIAQRGHHTINVELQNIDSTITHLFFTLSAYISPDISRFPSPSLKFYEASNPGKDLCGTTFTHARHSQAVIMCVLSRDANAGWKIFESGKLSAGNVKEYSPIISTIQELIKQGF